MPYTNPKVCAIILPRCWRKDSINKKTNSGQHLLQRKTPMKHTLTEYRMKFGSLSFKRIVYLETKEWLLFEANSVERYCLLSGSNPIGVINLNLLSSKCKRDISHLRHSAGSIFQFEQQMHIYTEHRHRAHRLTT